jgi:outer membrane protein TolC
MLEAAELEIKAAKAPLRPRVGLVARHDLVDDSPFGTHGDSSTLMAVASVDLFSGGRHRQAAAAARAEADAGAREVEQFRQGIWVAITDAYERARSARHRHETGVAAQEAAREVERIVQERFEQGVVKMIDLLDAVTARREADMRELMARADTHLAALRLAVQAGRAPESVLSSVED